MNRGLWNREAPIFIKECINTITVKLFNINDTNTVNRCIKMQTDLRMSLCPDSKDSFKQTRIDLLKFDIL